MPKNTKNELTLLGFLLRYKQLVFIFISICVAAGIIALMVMPQDEWPEFTIRQGLIIGIFPGASSGEVEEQLTAKVENYLFQYNSVKRSKTYSVSKENLMVIYVEISDKEKNPEAFWAKLRHGLNELKGQLPAGVISLTADNDFGNSSVLLLAIQSESRSYKELENIYLKQFENDLRRIESISRIKHYGTRREQISIYIDDAKLANYAIKPAQLFAVFKPQDSINYSGEIDDGKTVSPIHISSNYETETDIADQIVYSDPAGNVIRLKDVARVVREYEEPDSYIRANGRKCLIVSLEMKSGNNVVQLGKEVDKVIAKFSKTLPPDIKILTISDVPDAVSKSVTSFLKEFVIAIISVILVTILLLPARIARIAAVAIPCSIFTALTFMWMSGIYLHTVSLAALTIVLGITVDDAIVIIDNYIEKLDGGMQPFEAGSKSVTELFSSVLTATLTIIFCFVPMPFVSKGIAVDFIKWFPLTITFPLLASLLISVTLTPIYNYMFIKSGIKNNISHNGKNDFLGKIQELYDVLIEKAFSRKKLIIAVGLSSFVIGLAILALTPLKSFPDFEKNQFAVEVYLPTGSSLKQTDLVIKDLEDRLMKDKRVKVVTSFIGTSSPRFHALYAPNLPDRNYGQLVVLTESNEATEKILDEYSRKLRNHYPSANVKWKQLVAAVNKSPIEIRISGSDIPTIKKTADQVSDIIRNTRGTEFVRTDYNEPLRTFDLTLKKDEASRLGISNFLLRYSLMIGTKGLPVSTVWENDYPVNVKLIIDKRTKTGPDDIRNNYVLSPFSASSVPVRQIADVRAGWNEGQIVRRNGVRTLTVISEIERGNLPTTIFSRIRPQIEKIKLPEGVFIEYGGDYEDTAENLPPFLYSLIISIMIILMILMFQFKKLKTSLIIMITLPLSIFGAALGILVTGYPLGVTALMGLIGLMGIIVRNGVIYISYANDLQHTQGHSVEEAAIASAKRRMRPIFLTSAAAAAGVIPMMLSGSNLWGPLATVICFGLMFGLVLSLFVMPVIYYYFHRGDEVLKSS